MPLAVPTLLFHSMLLTHPPNLPPSTVFPRLLGHKSLSHSNSKQSGASKCTNSNVLQQLPTTCSSTTISLGRRMNTLPTPRPTPIILTTSTLTMPTHAHANPRPLFSRPPKMQATPELPTSNVHSSTVCPLPSMSPSSCRHTSATLTRPPVHQCSHMTRALTAITSARTTASQLDSTSCDLPPNGLELPTTVPV